MKRKRWQIKLRGFNRDHGISHIELKCILKNQVEPYLYKTMQSVNIPGKNKFPTLGIIRPAEQVNQTYDWGEPQRTFRIPLRFMFHWEGTEVATSLQSKFWDHSLSFSPSVYVKNTSGLDSQRMFYRGKKNIQDYLNNKQYIIIKHLAVQVHLFTLTI